MSHFCPKGQNLASFSFIEIASCTRFSKDDTQLTPRFSFASPHFSQTQAQVTDMLNMSNGQMLSLPQISNLDLQHLSELINQSMPTNWNQTTANAQSPCTPIIIVNWPSTSGTTSLPEPEPIRNNNKRRHSELFIDTSVAKRTKLDLPVFPSPKKHEISLDLLSPGKFLDEVDHWQFGHTLLGNANDLGTPTFGNSDQLLLDFVTTPTQQIPQVFTPLPTSKPEPIQMTQYTPTPSTPSPVLDEEPKKKRATRRKKSPSPEQDDTPQSTPQTPGENDRHLVCMGKRPRKNKKTQPEDQFLMKFSMRRNSTTK